MTKECGFVQQPGEGVKVFIVMHSNDVLLICLYFLRTFAVYVIQTFSTVLFPRHSTTPNAAKRIW